jgi:hypothetical protein
LQVALPEDPTGAQRFSKRDASLALRNSEAGVVDQVLLTTNEAGQAFVKVRVRSICIPQVSDWVLVRVAIPWKLLQLLRSPVCSACMVGNLAQRLHQGNSAAASGFRIWGRRA